MRRFAIVVCAFNLLVACAVGPSQRNPIDVSGQWQFQVDTGRAVTNGAMTVNRTAQGFGGTLTTDQGNNVLPIRSLTIEATKMLLVVESPNGSVTFDGTVSADGRSFDGTVTYYTGDRFPMRGNKR